MKYLMIALVFISCNNLSRNNQAFGQSLSKLSSKQLDSIRVAALSRYNQDTTQYRNPKISTEKLDSLHIKPYLVNAKPAIFETAFFTGEKVKMDSLTIHFFSVNIGKINIESGKIIACDPIMMIDEKPYEQTFPVGQFPVQLSIAKIGEDERVAFSRIYFSEKPVVKWEFALPSGQKQMPIGGETMYCYGVDAGLGAFMDVKAKEAYSRLLDKDEDFWKIVFIREMDKHFRYSWQWVLYNFENHNLAAFSSGYGDGHYGTYVGYDAKGQPCRLLTDFGLVTW